MALQHHDSEPTAVATSPSIAIEQQLTDGFAARLIRRKAKQLVRRAVFSRSDRADLEQELTLLVWKRRAQFDPAKAHWNAFVTTIVERHVATLLRKTRCKKRQESTPHRSLSELVEDGDNELVDLGDTISADDREPLTGRYVATAVNLSDLKLDLNTVMATLPEDLRTLCELLKDHNVTEAAAAMAIPRTTASSMVLRIRQHFADAGFEDFLPNPSSRGAQTQ